MTNRVIHLEKVKGRMPLKKRLSQSDVARISGVHRTYISGLKQGARNPPFLTAQKIAKALGKNAKIN